MLMKNGTTVPNILAETLEKDTYALMVFMKMSASYQEMCVQRFMRSDEASPRKRVQSVIEDIHKYGKLRGM